MEWTMTDKTNKIEQVKQECLHSKCKKCKGSGRKENGEPCVHYISCTCSKCRTSCL